MPIDLDDKWPRPGHPGAALRHDGDEVRYAVRYGVTGGRIGCGRVRRDSWTSARLARANRARMTSAGHGAAFLDLVLVPFSALVEEMRGEIPDEEGVFGSARRRSLLRLPQARARSIADSGGGMW